MGDRVGSLDRFGLSLGRLWRHFWALRGICEWYICVILGLLLVPLTNGDASFSGQIIGALTIFGWVFFTSLITFFVIKMVLGLRVSEEEEYEGSDLSECGMEAYPEFATTR